MPTYNFKNKTTGEITERFMTIAEMEKFLEEDDNMEICFTSAPAISDTVRMGMKKPDAPFRDLLRNMKKRSHGSNINDW